MVTHTSGGCNHVTGQEVANAGLRACEAPRFSDGVLHLRDDAQIIVCNVNRGFESPNPWTLNLRANPTTQVQIGPERGIYQAREANEAEVERYWPQLVQVSPAYQAHYDRSGQRFVFVLTPISFLHAATLE